MNHDIAMRLLIKTMSGEEIIIEKMGTAGKEPHLKGIKHLDKENSIWLMHKKWCQGKQ